MDSAGTAANGLWPGLFDGFDGLEALADWLSGERIEAAAEPAFAAGDHSWIVEDEPPLVDDFLSLEGDAFLFGSDAPTPDAGRVPETPVTPETPAADSPGASLSADAADDDGAGGPIADRPGFDLLPGEASGGEGGSGDPAAGTAFASGPDPEGVDTGSPVGPTPPPSLSDLPTDTPGPVDPDELPDTIPTDDGGEVNVADLDDGFDFLL